MKFLVPKIPIGEKSFFHAEQGKQECARGIKSELYLKKDNKITYGQVYCQNKKEVQQNQTVRLFMLSSGFSGNFMATSMF